MAIPAGVGLSLLLLTACGGASSTAAPASAATGSNAATTPAAHVPNGVSGQIMSVTGQVLQVQGPAGQTAVNWTDSTALSQVMPAAESDLAVGKCVQVRQAGAGSGGAGSGGAATPADPTQPLSAGTIVISDPVNGACLRTGSGGGGGGGGGARTGMARMGGGVRGTVASISGDTMTVTPTARPGSSTAPADTTPRTVTLTPSTDYSRIGSATSGDLTVGKCVAAFGTPANGGIDAKTVIVRPGGAPCTGAGTAMSGATSTPAPGLDTSGPATAAPSDNTSDTSTPASAGDSSPSGTSSGY
jgi:hypothetical protein